MLKLLWPLRQQLSYLATLDDLRANCHAGRRRPIFGAKLEAWRHKMCHIFHFLWSDKVLGILNLQWQKIADFNASPYIDVRTVKFFPSAESWLVNSNFRRASRVQGCRSVSLFNTLTGNLVRRVLSLPRGSTLVAAGHVPMHSNQSRTEGGSSTLNFINTVSGGESCAALQTLFWKLSKLFVRDPAWPVLRFCLNFYEYEMLIEREVCLFTNSLEWYFSDSISSFIFGRFLFFFIISLISADKKMAELSR